VAAGDEPAVARRRGPRHWCRAVDLDREAEPVCLRANHARASRSASVQASRVQPPSGSRPIVAGRRRARRTACSSVVEEEAVLEAIVSSASSRDRERAEAASASASSRRQHLRRPDRRVEDDSLFTAAAARCPRPSERGEARIRDEDDLQPALARERQHLLPLAG